MIKYVMRQVTLNSNLPTFGKISDEIWDLAAHHLEILKHKFPGYRCDLYESNEGWAVIRVESSEGAMIISASFSTDRVTIVHHVVISPFEREIIHYADPRLTDDIISDLIREQEILFEKGYGYPLCRYRHGRMMWEENR